jgi:hypothetical protein
MTKRSCGMHASCRVEVRSGSAGAVIVIASVLLALAGCEAEREGRVFFAEGGEFSCRVRRGVPECRGRNAHGVLGHDRFDEISESWVRAAPLDRVETLAVGLAHVCALRSDGRVYCWGLDAMGQLGDGPLVLGESDLSLTRITPVAVPGLDDAKAISATMFASCAMTSRGEVYCWGEGLECGSGRAGIQPPERVEVPSSAQIVANLGQTCVLTWERQVYCWGGFGGWVVDAEGKPRMAQRATRVPLADGADRIVAGPSSMCALVPGEERRCWTVYPPGRWNR